MFSTVLHDNLLDASNNIITQHEGNLRMIYKLKSQGEMTNKFSKDIL